MLGLRVDSTLSSSKTIHQVLALIAETLSSSSDLLEKKLIPSESEQILLGAFRKVTGKNLDRLSFYSQRDGAISSEVLDLALSFAQRRSQGELLQYILGYQFFFEHEYEVSPQVLVPRPETEVLISVAMERLSLIDQSGSFLGFEMGLGSGILSIELLSRFASLRMIATELSQGAIEIAQRNASHILGDGASRLMIHSVGHSMDVCETLISLGVRADFLISNPPYLLHSSEEVEDEVMAHEPHEALFAPEGRPNYFFEKMAHYGKDLLKQGGVLFLELPHERSQDIVKLFKEHGWETQLFRDLTDRDRVCCAQYKGGRI